MKWQKRDHYYIATGCSIADCRHGSRCGDRTCNRYHVCRCWIRSRDAWVYSAFHLAPLNPVDHRFRTGPSTHLHTGEKDACLSACKTHAADHIEAAA